MGRFSAVLVDLVALGTATSTGTIELTAANGDQLFAVTAGGEDEFIPPNVSRITVVATVTGGTGRFAGATGTFTMKSTGEIDFATQTSAGSGTFDGYLVLNK